MGIITDQEVAARHERLAYARAHRGRLSADDAAQDVLDRVAEHKWELEQTARHGFDVIKREAYVRLDRLHDAHPDDEMIAVQFKDAQAVAELVYSRRHHAQPALFNKVLTVAANAVVVKMMDASTADVKRLNKELMRILSARDLISSPEFASVEII